MAVEWDDTVKKDAYHVAIVLAAGKGSRMNSDVPKQYMMLNGKPIFVHSLEVMQTSEQIDGIVLVVEPGGVETVKHAYDSELQKCDKLIGILEGGSERYWSVYHALQYVKQIESEHRCFYVYIHDGARPYIDEALLKRLHQTVETEGACIAAVPVKDTIKQVDEEGRIQETPERRRLWAAQTPQVFELELIRDAYDRMIEMNQVDGITDDAQVLERMTDRKVKIVEGSYSNIKITTPEDLK